MALLALAPLVIDDPTENMRKQTIRPFTRRGVQRAVQGFFAQHFGVQDVRNAVTGLETREGLEQNAPRACLADTGLTHEHHTMRYLQDPMQLHHLVEPSAAGREVLGAAFSFDSGFQRVQRWRGRTHVGEHVRHQLGQQRCIGRDEPRWHRFQHTLHNSRSLIVTALHVRCSHEHSFESAQPKVVVRCVTQLLGTQLKEQHHLACERAGGRKAMHTQENVHDVLGIRLRHGDATKELDEVVWQMRAARVRRVHRDKDARRWLDRHAWTEVSLRGRRERVLNRLNLLRDARQHMLVEPIKLVKAAPGTDAAQPHKEAAHRTQIELRVAIKYQHKAPEFGAQCLDRLRLARTSRTKRRTATPGCQRMCQRHEARCRERCLHEPLLQAEDLEAIFKRSMRQADDDASPLLHVVSQLLLPCILGQRALRHGLVVRQQQHELLGLHAYMGRRYRHLALDVEQRPNGGVHARHTVLAHRALNAARPMNLAREHKELRGRTLQPRRHGRHITHKRLQRR